MRLHASKRLTRGQRLDSTSANAERCPARGTASRKTHHDSDCLDSGFTTCFALGLSFFGLAAVVFFGVFGGAEAFFLTGFASGLGASGHATAGCVSGVEA